MENEELARGLGMPAEVDIFIDPENSDLMRISFLTDKDFEESEKRGLHRPTDAERKTAVVDMRAGDFQITIYGPGSGPMICKRRILKFSADSTYSLF